MGQVSIPKGSNLKELRAPVLALEPGTHNLVATPQNDAPIAVDWVKFE